MQSFQANPTDAEVAEPLDAQGRSISVRIEDTHEQLVAHPKGYPIWFVAACIALPLVGWGTYLALKGISHAFDWIMLVLGLAVATFFVVLFGRMNREITGHGAFFILDKLHRTLSLPRSGVQFGHDDIHDFIEVRAWHTVRAGSESSSEWLAELSVLIRRKSGELARYPVVTAMRVGIVGHLALQLAEFFGVERRVLCRRRPP